MICWRCAGSRPCLTMAHFVPNSCWACLSCSDGEWREVLSGRSLRCDVSVIVVVRSSHLRLQLMQSFVWSSVWFCLQPRRWFCWFALGTAAVSHGGITKPSSGRACLHVRALEGVSVTVETLASVVELAFGCYVKAIVVDFALVQPLVSHGGFTQSV